MPGSQVRFEEAILGEVNSKIQDKRFDPLVRKHGKVTGTDLENVELQKLTEAWGAPVVELVVQKEMELDVHCPSGYYPGYNLLKTLEEIQGKVLAEWLECRALGFLPAKRKRCWGRPHRTRRGGAPRRALAQPTDAASYRSALPAVPTSTATNHQSSCRVGAAHAFGRRVVQQRPSGRLHHLPHPRPQHPPRHGNAARAWSCLVSQRPPSLLHRCQQQLPPYRVGVAHAGCRIDRRRPGGGG